MGKEFDVDEFLKEATFTVKLHGKPFTISDIPEETAEKFNDDKANTKEILKEVLNCTDEDLQGYGAIAQAKIVKEITDHFFRSGLLAGLSDDLSKQAQ